MVKLGQLIEDSISRKQVRNDELVTFIRMQDVTEDAVLKNQITIRKEEIKQGLTYFEKGDVLVAKITPCFENGKGAALSNISTNVGYGSTEFHVLRAKKTSDASYIYHHTRYRPFRTKLELDMVGTAGHRRVPLASIQNYMLPIEHSYTERKAIAEALSDVDALIDSLDALIAKKRQIKTGTMQQLLTGKTRLPGFGEGKGFKQSELGQIPEDWEVYQFSDHFEIYAGGDVPQNSTSAYKSEKYLIPIYANALQQGGLYGYTDRWRANAKSITVTARGTLGHAEYRNEKFFPIVRLLVLEPIRLLEPRFTAYSINELVTFAIESTGVPQLTAPQIGQYAISAPADLAEQIAIADVISDFDVEIALLEQRLTKIGRAHV